jgi:hypothetical protein
MRVRDNAHTFGDESIFSREATLVGDSIAKKTLLVDSNDFIRKADKDPYFAPLAGSELLPSGFYFMQLSQMTAVILSISLTYLDGYEYAWWRFALNSVAVLGLLGLLLTTEPYRKIESFSLHVQISLLVVSFMVTLTGFVGTLSSSSGHGIGTGSLNSNANYAFLGEASSSVGSSMNATSSLSSTDATNVRPSLQRFTVVLSYLTVAVVGIVAIFLVVSFFGALKVGAEHERQRNTQSVGLKVGVSPSRAVIYSLSSILRNQKPRVVGKEAKPPDVSSGIVTMPGPSSLPNESRPITKKPTFRVVSHAHGVSSVMKMISSQGEIQNMSFSPTRTRKFITSKRLPDTQRPVLANPRRQTSVRFFMPPSAMKKENI